jgi:transposase
MCERTGGCAGGQRRTWSGARRTGAAMIALQPDVRVYLACGHTDMRKGMQGLAMLVQQVLAEDPFNGALYAFRGRRGNLLKLVWHDGIGLCMLTKRLDRDHFIGPMTSTGSIALSVGQLVRAT